MKKCKISVDGCSGCESELFEALDWKKLNPEDSVFLEIDKHINFAIVDNKGDLIVESKSLKTIRDKAIKDVYNIYKQCWTGGRIKSFNLNKFEKELIKLNGS